MICFGIDVEKVSRSCLVTTLQKSRYRSGNTVIGRVSETPGLSVLGSRTVRDCVNQSGH